MNKKTTGIVVLVLVGLAALYFFIPRTAVSPTVESPTPSANEAGIETYTSQKLGIEFQYNAEPDPGVVMTVKEEGNKAFVYRVGGGLGDGQSVEVFDKNVGETFQSAIKRLILAKHPSELCKIEVTPSNIQGGYQVAEISYPQPEDASEPWFANSDLCNPNYDKTNGIRYFLYNPSYPDRFAFLSIGQYAILGLNEIPWQHTLKFIDR